MSEPWSNVRRRIYNLQNHSSTEEMQSQLGFRALSNRWCVSGVPPDMGVLKGRKILPAGGCLYNELLLGYYCPYNEFAEVPPIYGSGDFAFWKKPDFFFD